MSDRIFIHRYTLHSKSGLNSRSDRTAHEGALIRIGDGVGCLHPWRELGDPSLDELLDDLRQHHFFRPLVGAAVRCAMVDGSARKQGVSLFDGVTVPESHATVAGGLEEIQRAVSAGFKVVKMKAGRDLKHELSVLRESYTAYPDLRWRLDFNGTMQLQAMLSFLGDLDDGMLGKIDFLEDPFEVGSEEWERLHEMYSIPLAVDRCVEKAPCIATFAVCKPALEDITAMSARAMLNGWDIVVTSYMDHPIGQCYAAWSAAKVEQRYYGVLDPTAGLMTHGLYEPNAFIERLGAPSPQWKSPGGTGFGFDDLLEKLDWERLS